MEQSSKNGNLNEEEKGDEIVNGSDAVNGTASNVNGDSEKPSFVLPTWLKADLFIDLLKQDLDNFKKIINFEAAPAVNTGENFMTILLRANIDVELQDGKQTRTSYMIKIMPSFERMKAMATIWKVFDKEKHTYATFIPEFEEMYRKAGKKVKFGPKVMPLTADDDEQFLVLEDLRPAGFHNIKRQEGLDKLHTEATLERMAEFHAASACYYESHGPYPVMYTRCLCSEVDLFAEHRIGVGKLIVDNLDLYNARHLKAQMSEYIAEAPDQYQILSPLDENEFNVLNHGDCWANNIMFTHDDEGKITETIFVDYQMSRYGSPAQDLIYMLISSTSLDVKVRLFDYFIGYYHRKLLENLKLLNYSKPLPTLRSLHISLFRHGDWFYCVSSALMPVVLLEPNKDANIDNIISEDEKGNDLKKMMYTNNRYVEHMKVMLPWMANRGLLTYKPLN